MFILIKILNFEMVAYTAVDVAKFTGQLLVHESFFHMNVLDILCLSSYVVPKIVTILEYSGLFLYFNINMNPYIIYIKYNDFELDDFESNI